MSEFTPISDATLSDATAPAFDDDDGWAPKRTLTLASARAHSRRVRRVQIGLVAVAIALVLFLLFQFLTRTQTPIFEQDVDETVRMVSPRYIGRTSDGLPYTLKAAEAGRVRNRPNELNLITPLLNFYRIKGVEASTIDALSGIYNEVEQTLELRTDVVLATDDGNECKTTHARILLDTKIIEGDEFIRCTGEFGVVEGNAYEIRNNYKTFVFKDGMSGLLEPDNNATLTSGEEEL